MDIEDTIYPGGFFSLMQALERKEPPYEGALDVLPKAQADLSALRDALLSPDLPRVEKAHRCDAPGKMAEYEHEFRGRSRLLAVHAMCIAVLRRHPAPPEAVQLFLRLWREEGRFLASELPVRWLISAATTFADHGETFDQRSGGMGLSMLYDLIKLHDTERRISGRPNDQAFARLKKRDTNHPLAFDMVPYSLEHGDLDRNMLARLWRLAERDDVLQPLGFRMLRLVMHDRRTVFARMQRYKPRRAPDE